ncbi:MAG: SPFH domain-containing protein [Deltaproteobacteria bacterium]|nr:SPFH domain-containing protein [Candidatus Tharpellaceae bacterium]
MKHTREIVTLVVVGVLIFLGINAAVYFSPEVNAHQRGVLVNLYGKHKGVQAEELLPGKYLWFLSGFDPLTQRILIVDIAESNLELVNRGAAEGKADGEMSSVTLETKDSEIIHADVSIWYRVLPEQADVFVAAVAPDDIFSLVSNTARSIIRNKSGYFEVEDIFSGQVKEQIIDLSKKAMNEELNKRGMEVVSIEFKKLVFSDEIVAKLTEKTLSAKDIEINKNKTLAAIETAKKIEEEAKGIKLVKIQKAEAEKRSTVLASEAQMVKARNNMEADKMQANGILAIGKAEAESKTLELHAYGGDGGERYMRIKIAESLGEGMSNWQIIPENMNITAIAENFDKAINVGLPAAQNTKRSKTKK